MKHETIIKHEVLGVWFEARADLVGGVEVSGNCNLWSEVSPRLLGPASMAFGAWHAMEIRPQLDSFAGYDTVEFT